MLKNLFKPHVQLLLQGKEFLLLMNRLELLERGCVGCVVVDRDRSIIGISGVDVLFVMILPLSMYVCM